MATALTTAVSDRTGLVALAGLAYVVLLATLLGSGIWTALLARHPSGVVAPLSVLLPVAGVSSSWLLLGDRTAPVEFALGAVVVIGVLIGATPPRRPRAAPSLEPSLEAAPRPSRTQPPRAR